MYRCANCGCSSDERPLFRTSPFGENFVGQCKPCMAVDNLPIDAELGDIVDMLEEVGNS